MEESITYQEIVGIGRIKALHETILDQGQIKFGRPSRAVKQRLAEIEDRDRLAALARRLLQVDTWDELLAGT